MADKLAGQSETNGSDRTKTADAEYADRFVSVSDRVEKLLRRAVWGGLTLLIAAQLLLSVSAVRHWIVKVERLEGVPFRQYGP